MPPRQHKPRKPQSSGISETLRSLVRPPSTFLPDTPPHFSLSSALVSNAISPAERNSPVRDAAISQDGNPDQPETPDASSDQEEPAPQSDVSLAQSLDRLVTQLASLSAVSKSPSAVTHRVPDIFNGTNTSLLDTFIFQCSMYISLCISDFPDDESRILFAISYLGDTPLDWFRTELISALSTGGAPPPWFQSYPKFIAELQRLFGPQDPATEAMDALEGLHYRDQTKAARYTVSFNQHASRTGWNDRALARQYYKGLPDRLKDDIARFGKPTTLRALQDLVTALNQRYWERQSESTSTHHRHHLSRVVQRRGGTKRKVGECWGTSDAAAGDRRNKQVRTWLQLVRCALAIRRVLISGEAEAEDRRNGQQMKRTGQRITVVDRG